MTEDSIRSEPYTWRTVLEGLAVGMLGQWVTLLILRAHVSPEASNSAGLGVLVTIMMFWRAQPRSRAYWTALLTVAAVGAAVALALGWLHTPGSTR